METLLRFLWTHCAKLAFTDMGSHLQAFFHKLNGKRREPMGRVGVHETETSTPTSFEMGFGKGYNGQRLAPR